MKSLSSSELIPIQVFPQDPWSTPDPVTVFVQRPILTGPVGSRIAVYDYNRDRNKTFMPARTLEDGTFPGYKTSDLRFHQLNAYAISMRAIELVEMELGHSIRWGFDASRLIVLPHAGYLANAFYSEDTHSLQFYSFISPGQKDIYHTCLSHDIVAHETGHAILDAVRDRLTEGLHPETAALHEAIGDITALFAALSHNMILEKSSDKLGKSNLISDIAEHFEGNHHALRNFLIGPKHEEYWEEIFSPHDLSLKMSSAIYETLRALQEHLADNEGMEKIPALKLARRALQRMVVRGLDYLPPADATFKDFGKAILKADQKVNKGDKFKFRNIVADTLVEYGILNQSEIDANSGPSGDIWPHLPPFWPRPTKEDAYRFLDKNRKRLALSKFGDYRDFVLCEALYTTPPKKRQERDKVNPRKDLIEQVILIYEYPVDVELKGHDFGYADGRWLTIWGGGTLVFDAEGRELYHAQKPVTKKRIEAIKDFVRLGIVKKLTFPLNPTIDDEISQYHFKKPWKLALTSDRVALQTNPAARCYSARKDVRGKK